MYKRAVITDEISQDFARAVEVAREFGLDGVELRSAWDKNPHELGKDERRQIRILADQAGLAIPCIAAPIFKCQLYDERDHQEHLTVLQRCLEVAHEMGAGLIRGFTFWDDGNFERALPWIAERLTAIEPILQEAKVRMVLKSDPATAANSHQKLARVLALVASDVIRALWDPGNNLYVSGAGRPFPEGYELLRPYLAHIHVKDVCRPTGAAEPEACCLGRGEVGFAQVFQRLLADGYEGWLSLETHYRKRGPISDELLALPKGSAFSLGGEEASREVPGRVERDDVPMKFAICNELFEGWDFARTAAFVAGLGYEGLEIAPYTLADSVHEITPVRRRELKAIAEGAGLKITGLHWLLVKPEGLHVAHPDAAVRQRTVDYLRALIDFCADLGGTILTFGSPKQRSLAPELGPGRGRRLALASFAACGEAAAGRGVTLCLEALPPDLTNFLNTNAEILALVKEIDHPNIRMMVDVKSMCAEPIPVPENLAACQGFFRHVHANDANMRGPGFGAVDFRPILRTLRDLQYDGYISVEVFDYTPDPETIARESLRYMRECLPG